MMNESEPTVNLFDYFFNMPGLGFQQLSSIFTSKPGKENLI